MRFRRFQEAFYEVFMAIAVSDAAAATNSDGDDVENGPKRDDGYALISGDAVTVGPFDTLTPAGDQIFFPTLG
jgi:hypothetical protein